MAKKNELISANEINIIGKGTYVEGTFNSESDVNLQGTLKGKMVVKGRANIAAGGQIEGELVAGNAGIAGTVTGEITARELVMLKGSARVEGDIHTARLVIEEGAAFNGQCTMGASTNDPIAFSTDRAEIEA